jgi:hypothetical protein
MILDLFFVLLIWRKERKDYEVSVRALGQPKDVAHPTREALPHLWRER